MLLSAAVAYFIGVPLVRSLEEPSRFRDFIADGGFWGRAAFVGIVILQLFVALIPGGPVQVAAGYAYGWLEGAALCLLGTAIGAACVLLFVRRFGVKAVEAFYSREQINSLGFIRNEKRLDVLIFFLYLIPGTPKDAITYFAGLTRMPVVRFIVLTTLARLPAVVLSTVSGDALVGENYGTAGALFIALCAVSLAGVAAYAWYAKKRKKSDNGE